MDVDRVRFTLADYHRVRLEKVERYAHFLLADEGQGWLGGGGRVVCV